MPRNYSTTDQPLLSPALPAGDWVSGLHRHHRRRAQSKLSNRQQLIISVSLGQGMDVIECGKAKLFTVCGCAPTHPPSSSCLHVLVSVLGPEELLCKSGKATERAFDCWPQYDSGSRNVILGHSPFPARQPPPPNVPFRPTPTPQPSSFCSERTRPSGIESTIHL